MKNALRPRDFTPAVLMMAFSATIGGDATAMVGVNVNYKKREICFDIKIRETSFEHRVSLSYVENMESFIRQEFRAWCKHHREQIWEIILAE